jgi:hypothetical protein
MTSPLHGEDPVFKSPRAHFIVIIFFNHNYGHTILSELSMNEKMILIQYAIQKYENEEELLEKLQNVLPEKDIQRSLDTLIGTQRVRRIGPEVLQNNVSHTELPDLPDNIKDLLEKI